MVPYHNHHHHPYPAKRRALAKRIPLYSSCAPSTAFASVTLASPTRVNANRKSGGPINKFKAIMAVATEANCSPQSENFTEHVLAKPNATPA